MTHVCGHHIVAMSYQQPQLLSKEAPPQHYNQPSASNFISFQGCRLRLDRFSSISFIIYLFIILLLFQAGGVKKPASLALRLLVGPVS